jgi:hypothetical protein
VLLVTLLFRGQRSGPLEGRQRCQDITQDARLGLRARKLAEESDRSAMLDNIQHLLAGLSARANAARADVRSLRAPAARDDAEEDARGVGQVEITEGWRRCFDS